MRTEFQSCGYWMRRPTGFTQAEIVPYYSDVIGLPVMRTGPDVSLLWAGEDIVFEVKTADEPGIDGSPLAVAPLLPLFRSHDLAATRSRLAAHGQTEFTEESTDHAQRLWVRGPDGLTVGFEERSEDSPLEADRLALTRWKAGAIGLDGVPPLPADLQYLSRARRRVADVEAARHFYRQVAGFDEVGTEGEAVLFALGDTVLLELVGGGVARPTPGNRMELTDSFIMRAHDFDGCVAGLDGSGATWVGEQIRYATGSNLAYFSDPEGSVIGFEERSSYGEYVDDIESHRRWLLQTSAGERP